MIHHRYTIRSYYELDENNKEVERLLSVKPLAGYDSIQQVIDWCNANGILYDDILITEWNIDDEFDVYGVPDIVASVNLFHVIADQERETLSRYSIW